MPVFVFDADGTLYVHRNQRDAYLKALGGDYSDEREAYKAVARRLGDPTYMNQRVFFALVAGGSPSEAIRKAHEMRRVFREEILKEIEPSRLAGLLPDIYARFPVFVASNDAKDFLLDKLARIGALPYIHEIFTARDFGVLKPHEAFFTRLRAEIEERVGHTRMIFVDDLAENREAAEEAGFEAYDPEEFYELYSEGKLM